MLGCELWSSCGWSQCLLVSDGPGGAEYQLTHVYDGIFGRERQTLELSQQKKAKLAGVGDLGEY